MSPVYTHFSDGKEMGYLFEELVPVNDLKALVVQMQMKDGSKYVIIPGIVLKHNMETPNPDITKSSVRRLDPEEKIELMEELKNYNFQGPMHLW